MENTKDQVAKIVGKIKEIRRQRGYSNDAMAIDLDMSTSAYNKMERLETALTLERFLRIREILNVPFSEFFECNGNTYQQSFNDHSVGHYQVQTLYQANKEMYEVFLKEKNEEIAFLRNMLERKNIAI